MQPAAAAHEVATPRLEAAEKARKDAEQRAARLQRELNKERQLREDKERQLREEKEKSTCAVCFDSAPNCVFQCGHIFCMECAAKVAQCPTCRQDVKGRTKLFM